MGVGVGVAVGVGVGVAVGAGVGVTKIGVGVGVAQPSSDTIIPKTNTLQSHWFVSKRLKYRGSLSIRISFSHFLYDEYQYNANGLNCKSCSGKVQ